LFFREPSQVIHSIVLLFLIVIFVISVSGMKFVGFGNFYLQTIIYLSVFLFNLFFISTLSLRFIFPLISLEGLSFWKLKSAPVKIKGFIRNKLIVISSIILIISAGLSFFSNYKFGFLLTIISLTVTLFASAVIISINFGMGGIFSNYNEKNAIRLSSSQGATLSFLTNIVYMLFIIVLLFKPVSQLFLSIMIKEFFDLKVFLLALIPIVLVSVIIIYIYLKSAYRSLQKDF
jgi:ABC-2 type transport system permease protein